MHQPNDKPMFGIVYAAVDHVVCRAPGHERVSREAMGDWEHLHAVGPSCPIVSGTSAAHSTGFLSFVLPYGCRQLPVH